MKTIFVSGENAHMSAVTLNTVYPNFKMVCETSCHLSLLKHGLGFPNIFSCKLLVHCKAVIVMVKNDVFA